MKRYDAQSPDVLRKQLRALKALKEAAEPEMETLTDAVPATPGWKWKQTHPDNYIVWNDDESKMRPYRGSAYVASLDGTPPFSFASYLRMCWWAGSAGINPTKSN